MTDIMIIKTDQHRSVFQLRQERERYYDLYDQKGKQTGFAANS